MISHHDKHHGRWRDRLLLLITSLAACAVVGGAFLFTESHHMNPMWVFLPLISFGFFAQVGWDYRREFRSVSFCLFFSSWLLIHMLSFLFVVGTVGWLFLIPTVLIEIFLFCLTAYWLFGLSPPLRLRKKDSGHGRGGNGSNRD